MVGTSDLEEFAVDTIDSWYDCWVRYVDRVGARSDYRAILLMKSVVLRRAFAVKDKRDTPEL